MKVIRQIITYLYHRGALTDDDLLYLDSQGCDVTGLSSRDDLIDPEDALALDALMDLLSEATDDGPEAPDKYDTEMERSLQEEKVALRRRRKVHHKGWVMKATEICAQISAERPGWKEDLRGIVTLAGLLDNPGANMESAPLTICKAKMDALDAALSKAFESHALTLETLWSALRMEAYRAIGQGEGLHGPAVNAYRGVLQSAGRATSDSRAWILKHEEIRWAYHLAQAQLRLFEACGRLYTSHPERIHRTLRGDVPPDALWAFVFVYNADRFAAGHSFEDAQAFLKERSIACDLPPRRVWQRAWEQAIRMAPGVVIPFLGSYLSSYIDAQTTERITTRLRTTAHNHEVIWQPYNSIHPDGPMYASGLFCPRQWSGPS